MVHGRGLGVGEAKRPNSLLIYVLPFLFLRDGGVLGRARQAARPKAEFENQRLG